MIESIRYFEEECIEKFEKLENDFIKEPTKLAEYVLGLEAELHNLGLRMIQESLECMDEMLVSSLFRKNRWHVESHTAKSLITTLGTVSFRKTLFTSKETGESEYLLDRILGLDRNERITEDAVANMLTEAVQTSYRRGGEMTSVTAPVSKQAVKNKIHALRFPEQEPYTGTKKIVDYLYIEADEDHASLQFKEHKGDLITNEYHQKNNCLITKLVYVHEGIEKESPKSKRHRLINPYYFCGTNHSENNDVFWEKVYQYISAHYDLDKVKKIYLNADGGSWIMAAKKKIAGITYVLDEFHIEKHITKLTSHMKDSKEDATRELRTAIRSGSKKDFEDIVERLKDCLNGEEGLDRINNASAYILSNWTAAKLRLRHKDGVIGSSTEGHVSHVLASRMSSRPMGWSVQGATNMAKLIAYEKNGGNMLELVRYQKKELPKAVGAENELLSLSDILSSEINRHGELGKYMDSMRCHLELQVKKQACFHPHIWGL